MTGHTGKTEDICDQENAPHILRLVPIAKIRTDFPSKFGIPRQAGLMRGLQGKIIFEPDFRVDETVRGLEEFSHIWLIWGFSEHVGHGWSPTVRPPRLGGNVRKGVFATRSPFRPNGLGLSCVRLLSLQKEEGLGITLLVEGADMVDGTPIYDIKPYIPYADSVPDARGGFAPDEGALLSVNIPWEQEEKLPPQKRAGLRDVLAHDPRPPYQEDPERIYGMSFAGFEIRFRVEDATLFVLDIKQSI